MNNTKRPITVFSLPHEVEGEVCPEEGKAVPITENLKLFPLTIKENEGKLNEALLFIGKIVLLFCLGSFHAKVKSICNPHSDRV